MESSKYFGVWSSSVVFLILCFLRFREMAVDSCSGYLFSTIIFIMTITCAVLFQFQVVSNHTFTLTCCNFDSHFQSAQNMTIQLYQATGIGIMVTFSLFIFCLTGEMVSGESYRIHFAAYNCKWYRFPVKYRFYTLKVITFAQEPYYVTALGFINCSISNFSDVSELIFVNYGIRTYMENYSYLLLANEDVLLFLYVPEARWCEVTLMIWLHTHFIFWMH